MAQLASTSAFETETMLRNASPGQMDAMRLSARNCVRHWLAIAQRLGKVRSDLPGNEDAIEARLTQGFDDLLDEFLARAPE